MAQTEATKEPTKLILCFDGTGNSFSGSNADTNVVKILRMLDRTHPNQYHYYQTGIGTYDINETSVNKTWVGEIRSFVSQTIDQGFATTFDAHVMAGYRFLMRYYESGAKIYMFGFSRGAYTAKFLARMINTVGLLCKGNEEMVPFAYLLYQRYLSGKLNDRIAEQQELFDKANTIERLVKGVPGITKNLNFSMEQLANTLTAEQLKKAASIGHVTTSNSIDKIKLAVAAAMKPDKLRNTISDNLTKAMQAATTDQPTNSTTQRRPVGTMDVDQLEKDQLDEESRQPKEDVNEALDELRAFSETFCREETDEDGSGRNIKVYFLGIWDCVSSVAVLEQKAPIPVEVIGTAHIVRHAVAVDERRVKFKAALLAQDIKDTKNTKAEDIKEVWFPGCHGDVGGGWPACQDGMSTDNDSQTFGQHLTQSIQNFLRSSKPQGPSHDVGADEFQMSDVPLAWMIHELELVGKAKPSASVKWNVNRDTFHERFDEWYKNKKLAFGGFVHDSLSYGYGTGFAKVLLWKFMEYLPLITRWELCWTEIKPVWENVRFPLNKGSTRDMPYNAVLHESVIHRLKENSSYTPANTNGRGTMRCLWRNGEIADLKLIGTPAADAKHQVYKFSKVSSDSSDHGSAHLSMLRKNGGHYWAVQLGLVCVGIGVSVFVARWIGLSTFGR